MRPNKFLGQNFLRSKFIVGKIISAADIKPNDVILEAGPGTGFLTEELVKTGARVIAVEKDKRMAEFLKEKFKNTKNLKIIHGDILKSQISNLKSQKYKIVANIPYYITSCFLRKFLESDEQPSLMVLMVQKEVAERIVSKKGSILSVSVKTYGIPRIIKRVPAESFSPKPKVDSAILLINKISKVFFKDINETKFFSLVRKGFSSKRKMLKNNLDLSDIKCLAGCGILEKARAEDLSPENWKCLYKDIYKRYKVI